MVLGEVSEKIHEKYEDLSRVPQEFFLAHCVVEDMHIGAGIARVFRKYFAGQEEMWKHSVKTGEVDTLQLNSHK